MFYAQRSWWAHSLPPTSFTLLPFPSLPFPARECRAIMVRRAGDGSVSAILYPPFAHPPHFLDVDKRSTHRHAPPANHPHTSATNHNHSIPYQSPIPDVPSRPPPPARRPPSLPIVPMQRKVACHRRGPGHRNTSPNPFPSPPLPSHPPPSPSQHSTAHAPMRAVTQSTQIRANNTYWSVNCRLLTWL